MSCHHLSLQERFQINLFDERRMAAQFHEQMNLFYYSQDLGYDTLIHSESFHFDYWLARFSETVRYENSIAYYPEVLSDN